jgi:hypothetical protein
MPKRTAPVDDGIIGNSFAVTCGKPGDYYVADPAAPLKHGCHVVVQVAPGRWYTEGTLRTKHPTRSKTLSVEMERGHIERRVERTRVARVVGRFQAVDTPWARGRQDAAARHTRAAIRSASSHHSEQGD